MAIQLYSFRLSFECAIIGCMSENKVWKEKKTSLGNAIIVGAIFVVLSFIVGLNWNSWFGGFMPYLGIGGSSNTDW